MSSMVTRASNEGGDVSRLSLLELWTVVVLASVVFTSGADMMVMTPVLPQLATELGVEVSRAGLWVTAYGATTALVAIIFGPISDRFGRKRVLVGGLCILAAGTSACAVATDFWTMLLARMVAGAGAGMLVTSTTSFAGDHFRARHRGRVMGHVMNGFFLSLVLAVPIGAWLASRLGWNRMFWALSAEALVVAALVAFTIPKPRQQVCTPTLSWSAAIAGYRDLLALRAVRGVLQMSMAIGLSMSMYTVYASPWMEREFGLNTADRGVIYALCAPAILLGGPLAGRWADQVGRLRVIVASSVLMAAMQALMPLTAWASELMRAPLALGHPLSSLGHVRWPLMIPCLTTFFLVMLAGASRSAPYQTLAIEVVRPEQRGALTAVRNTFGQVGNSLGAALGGLLWATPALGYGAVCWVAAAITLGAAIALTAMLRNRAPAA